MALPAGRYGVTKNQLLKIKKLPMNTIKLIEELTEKFDLLGSAAFKNSTSVVTDSSDLVESGAVFDALGFGNKNLFGAGYSAVDVTNELRPSALQRLIATINNPNEIVFRGNNGDYSSAYFEIDGIDGTDDYAITYDIKDNNTGYTPTVSIYSDATTSSKLTLFIYARNGTTALSSDKHFTLYNIQVEKGTTATAYEPYHASVEESKCDNSVIAPVENGTTASQAYAVGEHFIRNGAFCTVTQAISSGGTLTEGANYTSGDVADELTKTLTTVTNAHSKVTIGVNSVAKYGKVVYLRVDFSVSEAITRVGLFRTGYGRGTNVNSRISIYNTDTGDIVGFADINNTGELNNIFTLNPGNYTVFGSYISE